MRENYNSKSKNLYKFYAFFLFVGLLFSNNSFAQVTTNGGSGLAPSYADLASAITALNGATISSPVVITLDPSNPQTAPAGGYLITAQGDIVNTITIQGNGNTITASNALTPGALNDAIFKLQGADYVTLQNFVMQENAANTTTTAASNNMTEWGVALLYATTTNGAQNNTIQNNTIVLNRTYQNTFGIYSNSTHALATPTTAATATTTSGGNHGLKVYSNAISNVNLGIVIVGPTAIADQNTGIDVGGSSLATGNTITNFGTTGTFSSYANVSGSVNGILVRNSNGTTISYNTITSSVGGVTAGTLNGIQVQASSNAPTGLTFTNTINNNTISLQSGLASGTMNGINYPSGSASTTSSVIINNNNFNNFGHSVAGSGTINFITTSGTDLNKTINGNTFSNISVNTTGNVTFISNSVTRPANAICNVNNNVIVGTFSKTGAGGTITFYTSNGTTPITGTENNLNNNFSNITVTGATTIAGWISTDGSATSPYGPVKNVSNNTFSNITGGTSGITVLNVGYSNANATSNVSNNTINNISGANSIIGITSAQGNQDFFGNNINGLTTTGSSTVSALSITGGGIQKVYKNKIYNVEANNASGLVNGILVTSGTTVNLYNNIIGDLRTPVANATNPLNGINITGGTTVNVYYNTVMLNGSSTGALFGSSAISAATATNLDLRNNIFVNNSSISGAGLATAYRRSSTTLTSYAANSNNNLFYGSTIFTDGTNTDATLGAYQSRVATRDASSISINPSFTSTAGSNSQFLHIDTATPTLIEGGATNIASYTDDFDGDARNGSTPDIGADEFTGTPVATVVINSVGITPTGNQCTAVSRNVTANITAGGTDITSVSLNYSFNGVAQTPIAMTGGTLTAGSTSTFSATIPVASPVNANVTWFVSATDPFLTKSTSGTAYQDEPLFGVTATATASVVTICNSGNTVLSASLSKNGNSSSLGNGITTTGSTEELTAFCNRRISYRVQLVYTAAELTASGLGAGPITSLAFNISTLGDSASNTAFTVKMGSTSLSTLTDYVSSASFTTVLPSTTFTHAIGSNVIPFSTPFVWDGTSNVIVEVSHNGIDSINNAQTYYTTTSGNTVAYGYNGAVTGTLSTKRFNVIFGGNVVPSVTNYSWSDGSTVVGTTNNLTVSPTTTTTYTATLTSNGCTIATNSVLVTVNTTAAPTGSSTQSFTSGQTLADIVVTGNSIIWYASASDAASAINPLPNSTILVNNTTYYATQTVGGCSSTSSLAVTAQVSLGINDFDSSAFKAYPNPTDTVLNIEYNTNLINVTVCNMLGQQVLIKKVSAPSTKIDMSELNAGTYLVKIDTENGSKTLKVVKK